MELGLKPETADMHITNMSNKGINYTDDYQIGSISFERVMSFCKEKGLKLENTAWEIIPAWSLHRLKCLLPTKIPYESGYLTVEIINNVNLMFITDTSEQRVISFIHENLYESIINCIKWLINEGYFNKEYLKQ